MARQVPIDVYELKRLILNRLEKNNLRFEKQFLEHVWIFWEKRENHKRYRGTYFDAKARWSMSEIMYRSLAKELGEFKDKEPTDSK